MYITRDKRERIEGYFERSVKWLLNHAFTNSDFFTLSEIAKFKPSEDESIWEQAKGNKDEVVEVYNKGVWLCDVHSGMTRDQIINRVWKSLEFNKAKKAREESEKNANSNNTTTY